MRILCLFMAVLLTSTIGNSLADDTKDPSAVQLTVARPIHPILIRNAHGPTLTLVLDVKADASINVSKFTFRLDGTDDLNDLQSLSLFACGSDESLKPAQPFGEAATPAQTIEFQGQQTLVAGKHVFWLSTTLKPTASLLHRVAAACVEIETTAGLLKPVANAAPASHRIGIALRKHQDDDVHTYRIPAMSTSPKGSLLAVYDMRRREGRDLQEDIDIGLSRSTDGGQTWEPARVIMDMGENAGMPQELNGCSDPGLIIDQQTGEIFCFALWMQGKAGKHQWVDDGSEPGFDIGKTAQFMMVRSTDDGLTWSTPTNLTRSLKQESWWLFAPSPQSGFQLADGTLVMPVQGRTGREPDATFATIMISRDHGQSWSVGNPAYSGGNECQAALLSDHSLMLNIRNDKERFRAVAVTKDLGQTWEAHPTSRNTLIEPNCNGSLLRVTFERSGELHHALLFANPHTQKGRTHHTIQVSFDDGMTWPKSHHLLLDEGRGAGYPSLTQIDKDHVGIVYEGSQAHLVFEKFSLDELLKQSQHTDPR